MKTSKKKLEYIFCKRTIQNLSFLLIVGITGWTDNYHISNEKLSSLYNPENYYLSKFT
jgi:hypothetical protein